MELHQQYSIAVEFAFVISGNAINTVTVLQRET